MLCYWRLRIAKPASLAAGEVSHVSLGRESEICYAELVLGSVGGRDKSGSGAML